MDNNMTWKSFWAMSSVVVAAVVSVALFIVGTVDGRIAKQDDKMLSIVDKVASVQVKLTDKVIEVERGARVSDEKIRDDLMRELRLLESRLSN